jgi:hypothetical protein
MHPTRHLLRPPRWLIALAIALAAGACGDGEMTRDPMNVPIDNSDAVCQGFSHGVWVRLCCGDREAASDGFCHYQVSTSNSNVLVIFDATHNVARNTCAPVTNLATVGKVAGTVDLVLENTTTHRVETIGTATVGNQPCF